MAFGARNMPSPILDTFKDAKYWFLAIPILAAYGVMLLFFDQFLFFAPYFIFYVPQTGEINLILDVILTTLTPVVVTVSIRQILLQRGGGGASKTGALGIIAALVAGACPCYYLVPLLAVAGTIGGALGAVGILLNAFQIPIKLAAILILVIATYKLNKSRVCKIKSPVQTVARQEAMK
jgi:hypothetical protein